MNLLWGGVSLFLCAALATALARRLMPVTREGAVTFGLAWSVFFFAIFFGPFLFLGLLGLLAGLPAVRAPFAVGLQILLAGAWFALGRREAPPAARTERRGSVLSLWSALSPPGRLLLAATAGTFLFLAGMLCLEFPRGYEPRAYHLPLAANIFETSSLELWDREYMDTFPANASVYYGFLLTFLSEHAVSAAEMPLLGLLLLGLYGLGRATGADREASLVAACGAASVPIVAFSVLECGADIGGVAFLAASAFFALSRSPARRINVVLAGLAAGIAFGFKSLHLVGAAFLLAAVAARGIAGTPANPVSARVKVGARAAALFGSAFLAVAGVWMVRNALRLGNPLYPVSVPVLSKALGWRTAPDIDYLSRGSTQLEWVRSSRGWLIYPWVEGHVHAENFKHSSGLGAFYAAFIPPALLVAILGLFFGSPGRAFRAALLAGTGVVAAAWWILGDRQPRYLMGAGVFALPLAAWMTARARGRARLAFVWIACVTSLAMFGIVLSRQGFEVGNRVLHQRRWTRSRFYFYPPGVDRLPPGAIVVNLIARTENWGLFGEDHRNRVVNSRQALRALGVGAEIERPAAITLEADALRGLGASHLVALSKTELRPGPGVSLIEMDHSGSKVSDPEVPVLYRVAYAEEGSVPVAASPAEVARAARNP